MFALLLSAAFLLLYPLLTWASNVENHEVLIIYDEPMHVLANETMEKFSLIKLELENTFRTQVDFKPTVRIIKDRETFLEVTGMTQAVAVAISQKDLIIIDNSRMRTHPFTLEVTLKHELCHLFLHHMVGNGSLPRWFNEGVSQWVSGGITEIIIGENKDLLKRATLSGRYIRISELNRQFPQDSSSLRLAYQESKSIVDYIVKEHGPDGILRIIKHLKEGRTMDSAVIRALSMSTGELEKRWHAHLKRKYTWFIYLSDNIYQILFTLAGLALLYGFIRVMLKKRAYKDDDEEEDDERNLPPV